MVKWKEDVGIPEIHWRMWWSCLLQGVWKDLSVHHGRLVLKPMRGHTKRAAQMDCSAVACSTWNLGVSWKRRSDQSSQTKRNSKAMLLFQMIPVCACLAWILCRYEHRWADFARSQEISMTDSWCQPQYSWPTHLQTLRHFISEKWATPGKLIIQNNSPAPTNPETFRPSEYSFYYFFFPCEEEK